jgi:NAD(P)-dependent dehydrogenase (short-subunit alcohol dehydrogenase family)
MAVVLVTGGSSGIGLATARRLAAAGDDVFSLARRPCPAEGVTSLELDLTDRRTAGVAVETVVASAGRLDAVVSNAGSGALAPLVEVDDDAVAAIFETNVLGPLRLAREAIAVMRTQRSGRLVFVTSLNDALPAPFGGHYSASKAAMAMAATVLDAEVRPFGISATVVAPGLFRTPMSEALPSAGVDDGSAYAPAFVRLAAAATARLEDAADPDDVAVAIARCLRAADPPARVVVGEDAEQYEALVRSTSHEDLAGLLRAAVRDLLA